MRTRSDGNGCLKDTSAWPKTILSLNAVFVYPAHRSPWSVLLSFANDLQSPTGCFLTAKRGVLVIRAPYIRAPDLCSQSY